MKENEESNADVNSSYENVSNMPMKRDVKPFINTAFAGIDL